MYKIFLMIAAVFLLIPSFANTAHASGEDELWGLGLGAVAGGVLGNQIGQGAGRVAATTGGVVLGAYAGDRIGHQMDMESGTSGGGTRSGAPYAPTGGDLFGDYQPNMSPNYVAQSAPDPSQIYIDNSYGSYCREISQPIQTNAGMRESYGMACLQPDGTWRVVQ